jgi:hypothetical protein
MTNYEDTAAFGSLCDAVAYRRLIAVTGSGVSVGLPNADSELPSMPTWYSVLIRLRERFAVQLSAAIPELDVLLNAHLRDSAYLIEAATLISQSVGAAAFRHAVVELTTPPRGTFSALHGLIEELEPLGIITFNYDMGHENAYESMQNRSSTALKRATYSDETRLRELLAGDFETRFLLKAHGSIVRPHTVVLDRESYREIMARQLGYRAFVHHVLTRFNALIVGFGLSDPDFDDMLQTFEENFGGGVRDHVYIWKRGQRDDEEARAIVLRRRYGLACIFVDSFEEVRSLIGDAGRHLGPRLRHTIAEALHRVPDAREYREQRRAAHIALSELSRTGARTAAAAFRATAVDSGAAPSVRAEAAYCLGKIRPTVTGTAEFLLSRVERDADPEIATFALAALLQLEPPVDKRIVAWTQAAQALMPICDDIDRNVTQLGPRGGRPRARKYLDALLARWNAMYANEYPNGIPTRAP